MVTKFMGAVHIMLMYVATLQAGAPTSTCSPSSGAHEMNNYINQA